MPARIKENIGVKDLGINLKSQEELELFKWFLASLLFGKPIQQEVAKNTYFEFVKEGLITPQKIIEAGWDKLVQVLDQGHYVRYDFSTATKLLDICQKLLQKYKTVKNLLDQSKSKEELAKRLEEFKGVGSVTSQIFIQGLADLHYF